MEALNSNNNNAAATTATATVSVPSSASSAPSSSSAAAAVSSSTPASSHSAVDYGRSLFIGNLAWATESHKLTLELSRYGAIEHAIVVVNRFTGKSKGFGFATFVSVADAAKALKMADGLEIDGRKIRLEFARKPRVGPMMMMMMGGEGESMQTETGCEASNLIKIGTIEVVGEVNEEDAKGVPPDDAEVAQILRASDLPPMHGTDAGGKGHRYTDESGTLITRYTRHRLQSAFQLMGLKKSRAEAMAASVFEAVRDNMTAERWIPMVIPKAVKFTRSPAKATAVYASYTTSHVKREGNEGDEDEALVKEDENGGAAAPTEAIIDLSQDKDAVGIEATVRLSRRQFAALVRNALAKNHHRKPQHLRDFDIACEVNEHRTSITVLLGGTSGCGKSTLASLLASRLGVTTVLSTDFVRHMLRKIYGKDKYPILWASTYNAGAAIENAEGLSGEEQVIKGYQMQSDMLLESLSYLMRSYENRKESLIIEGVHLSVDSIITLMQRHPTCIPFFVCIANEDKHRERFAVRAKYMTLDGRHNRYIKYFPNIRCIQSFLLKHAQEHLIPQIDNTNVDRSVSAVHDILVKCMRSLHRGRQLYDADRGQATHLWKVYSKRIKQSWSSKAMLQVIRSKISKGEVFRRYFENNDPPENPEVISVISPPEDPQTAMMEIVEPSVREDDLTETPLHPHATEDRSTIGSVGFTTQKEHSDKGDGDSDSESTSRSHCTELSAVNANEDEQRSSVVNVKSNSHVDIDGLSVPEEDDPPSPLASPTPSTEEKLTREDSLHL